MPPPETPRHSWASLGQFLVGSLFLSPGSWCAQGFVCAYQESVSPVFGKFWQLYGMVNGDLLQEGLCHTQVCCTQGPCPCGRPLLIHTFTGDTQALKGKSGSVCVGSFGVPKVLFEPSNRLWWVSDLILNVILPLQPSFWDFSFDLGGRISFFGTTQNSLVDGCSAGSCKFGVLAGEDEHMSFYSTIFKPQSCLQTSSD